MSDIKEVKRKLFDKFKKYYHDKYFVIGMISYTETDEERKDIIDYYDNGKDVSDVNKIWLSLYLNG